jgi:rhodanese-related sulfurtransferase
MIYHRLLLAGFAVAVGLTGCKSDASPSHDASASDQAATPDAFQNDAVADSIVAILNDGPVAAPDLAAPADTSDAGPPPSDGASLDPPAADGSRPEAPAPDGPASIDAGCTGWTTLQRISPAQASDLIATANPIVINVHIPYAGDIPGTDVDIPYNDVDAIETYLNHDHCADLLLVCLSGGMSQSAGSELIKRGYLRVRDLSGGMMAWQSAGYPLLMDGGT